MSTANMTTIDVVVYDNIGQGHDRAITFSNHHYNADLSLLIPSHMTFGDIGKATTIPPPSPWQTGHVGEVKDMALHKPDYTVFGQIAAAADLFRSEQFGVPFVTGLSPHMAHSLRAEVSEQFAEAGVRLDGFFKSLGGYINWPGFSHDVTFRSDDGRMVWRVDLGYSQTAASLAALWPNY